MNRSDELNREDQLLRENQALRDRLSRLSAASLRINDSLDFDAVLHGVLHSARDLTGAAYGVDDARGLMPSLSTKFSMNQSLQPDAVPGKIPCDPRVDHPASSPCLPSFSRSRPTSPSAGMPGRPCHGERLHANKLFPSL